MHVYPLLLPVVIEETRLPFRFLASATVLRTADELIIFDTGFPYGDDLALRLRELSLDPDDFTYVFNTHYHIDHFGSNRLFKNAVKVLSREEYEFQKAWSGRFLGSRDREGFLSSSFPLLGRRETRMLADFLFVVQEKYFSDDYFGDWERVQYLEDGPLLPDYVRAVHTPGHTPYHRSYIVKGSDSLVVTGDCIPGKKAFFGKRDNFIQVVTDSDAMRRSTGLIRELASAPGTVVQPSHAEPFMAEDGAPLREKVLHLA